MTVYRFRNGRPTMSGIGPKRLSFFADYPLTHTELCPNLTKPVCNVFWKNCRCPHRPRVKASPPIHQQNRTLFRRRRMTLRANSGVDIAAGLFVIPSESVGLRRDEAGRMPVLLAEYTMRIGGFPFCIDGLTSEWSGLCSPRTIVCVLRRSNRTLGIFVDPPRPGR